MRISVFDGLRGYFLIVMTMVHMSSECHTKIGALRIEDFGWVDSAHGFVFLSGLVVGIVYGRRLIRQSRSAMTSSLMRRLMTIYGYHAILLAAITLSVVTFYRPPSTFDTHWGENPLLVSLFAFLLLDSPRYLGILPMYATFVLATPIILIQLQKQRYALVLVSSLALWTVAQTGLPTHLLQAIDVASGLKQQGIAVGLYFDRFAWQILYVGGLVLGMLIAQEKLSLNILHSPEYRAIFLVCVATAIAFAISAIRLRLFDAVSRTSFFGELSYNRSHFSALRLINFIVDLYIITWLLAAGTGDRNPAVQAAARGLRWLASFRPLVFLGQHSLQVFSFHVFLVYAAMFADISEAPRLLREIVVLASPVCLLLPAYLHARYRDRSQRLRLSGAKP
ncbi:hypothetical protein CCR90_02935 [Rhodovulum sulfidophilum]|uniref:OpgC family protein n=1 Tax=Rhodovulum sulfidophilum TaxID=35806 RepID=UPI001912625B|nr:OpgC domain-containing protein [Rhodovulum sulfidophilum]MBK5922748.1 hypothetical protein [Rhodovulum sulfidophilum]